MRRLLTAPMQIQETTPPSIYRHEWSRCKTGFDLREVYYVDGVRHRRYVGHLGEKRWQKMLADFTDEERITAVEQWVKEKQDGRIKG